MRAFSLVLALTAISSVLAHPVHQHQRREIRIIGRDRSAKFARSEDVTVVGYDKVELVKPEGVAGAKVEAASGEPAKAEPAKAEPGKAEPAKAEPGKAEPAKESGKELEILVSGNKAFREEMQKNEPELLKKLTEEGQSPPFMFLGCSDSRVSEGSVFNAKPGTLFTQRNIANQFQSTDANAQSVLSYAVSELGVKHVIVMGHYGCGGVGAAIVPPPIGGVDAANGAVQSWIAPIREIFRTSSRPEIVELRGRINSTTTEEPDVKEPGFRALVEENVKASVSRIVSDSVITNHFAAVSELKGKEKVARDDHAPIAEVFVHGWVYDIENGEIRDLGISVGPAGMAIPSPPFELVAKAGQQIESAHK